MNKKLIYFFIALNFICYAILALANDIDINAGLAEKKTPQDINDDHIKARQINPKDMNSHAVSGGNIYFEVDKAIVVPTEHIKIEEIAIALKKLSPQISRIDIEGFASRDGDSKKNLNLGTQRAAAVMKALIGEGVSESLLNIISYGDKNNFQFENVNKNRRVQIRIYLKTKEN